MLIAEHKRSRHSFEVLVVGFCVFSGAVQVFTDKAPSNVARALGTEYQSVWSWCMLVAGVLALIGIMIKDEVTGSYFELGGMLGLGFGNLVYGVAVIAVAVAPGTTYAGPVTIGIAIASFVRAWRLARCLWHEMHQPDEERLVNEVRTQLTEAVEAEARQIVENRDKGGD